jgi:hypothetical protein
MPVFTGYAPLAVADCRADFCPVREEPVLGDLGRDGNVEPIGGLLWDCVAEVSARSVVPVRYKGCTTREGASAPLSIRQWLFLLLDARENSFKRTGLEVK